MSKKIEIVMPIRTVSEMNTRGHWSRRFKRQKSQQRDFNLLWKPEYTKAVSLPCRVTFTRYSNHQLDDDNIRSALKGIRDSLAAILGVDDGDESKIKFRYAQERINKRENYFVVRIENL